MSTDQSSIPLNGQLLCKGEVQLPLGSAGEELSSLAELEKSIPSEVEQLLEERGLRLLYDKMVGEIVAKKGIKGFMGWKTQKLLEILEEYEPKFRANNVELYACERRGSNRWIEFVDRTKVPKEYQPQYDMRRINKDSDKASTLFGSIKVPDGVVVEQLSVWSGRKQLQSTRPEKVQALVETKNATSEYTEFIKALCETKHSFFETWKAKEIKRVIAEFKERFAAKEIGLFGCAKVEYSYNGTGSHPNYFYWIEYADLSKLMNYRPDKNEIGVSDNLDDCVVM